MFEKELTSNSYAVAVLVVTPTGIPLVRDPTKPKPLYWKLPGGRSEGNESAKEAAKREIKEEIGVKLRDEELERVYSEVRGNHEFVLFQVTILHATRFSSAGNEGEEISLVLPIDLEKLKDLFPPHREVLEKIKFIGG